MGRTLICVTVNDPNDWQDHMALYDWAFGGYEIRTVARAGAPLLRAPGGGTLIAQAGLELALAPGEEPRLVYIPGLSYTDPGTVRVLLNGKAVAEIPVSKG